MDALSAVEGLPHLVVSSGQTLPNVIGIRELGAKSFLCLQTKGEPADRLVGTLRRLGAEPLAPAVTIDAFDANAIEVGVRALLPEWRALAPKGLVWNLTPGTKQMLLGCYRGLGLDEPDSIVRGAISVDTASGLLRLDRPAAGRPLRVRMDVASILDGHGIPAAPGHGTKWDGYAVKFQPPSQDESLFRELCLRLLPFVDTLAAIIGPARSMRQFDAPGGALRAFAKVPAVTSVLRELPKDVSAEEVVAGRWLEGAVAGALDLLRGQDGIDDVRRGVQLQVHDDQGWKTDTDLDVAATARNRLSYFSCKTDSVVACKEELFQIVARKEVGGSFARGVLVHWHEPTAKRVAGLRTRAQLLRIPVLDRSALRDRETLVTALREIVQPAPKPR